MIVHCTGCQARFRVPDEKVGPRGARIRCSRCQTLFTVGSPGTTPSAPLPVAARAAPRSRPEVELETPLPTPGLEFAADDPFAGFRLDAGPPFGPARAEPEPSPDPFAPTLEAREGFGPEGDGPGADPLAPGRTAQVAHLHDREADEPDPAWAGAAGVGAPAARAPAGRSASHVEGAEPAWMDDPFAAALSPRTERSSLSERSLPLTDLADLLGEPERPPSVPPPLPTSRGSAFPGEPGPGLDGPDLALEEPAARPPPARAADDDPLGGFPFAPLGGEQQAGPSELGPLADADEAPLALATEPAPGLPEMWRDGPAHLAEPEEAAATTAPAVPAREPGARAVAPEAPARPARDGALRSIAVNAASLAALLVLALGFRVLWRGPGAGEAAASPAALLRALGLGGRPAAPLETAGVTSGRYPRALGAPLLFVRGEVISRSAGPLARVRVDVEVVRGGRPIAARSALAGAIPTAEELFDVKDAAGLDALSSAVARRARPVRPGEPLPFLVAFTDVPDDLTGASLRVVASAVP